jgi:transcriptional regulator with XRE-family HTH domain
MTENKRIRELRQTLGLTQQNFADSIGVSKQYLSRVENGLTDLSKEKVQLICQKYNVSADWLFSGLGNMFLSDEKIQDLFFDKSINEFTNLLEIYNHYLLAVDEIVKKSYPNALMSDKIATAKEIFMNDCLNEEVFYSNIEITKNIIEGKKVDCDDFQIKILGTYYFKLTQREEMKQKTKSKLHD